MKKILAIASNATAFNWFCGIINNIRKFVVENQYSFVIFYANCNNIEELMKKNGFTEAEGEIELINAEKKFASSYSSILRKIYHHRWVSGTSLGKYLRYKDRVVQIREMKDNVKRWMERNTPDVVLLYGDRILWIETIAASVTKELALPSIFCFNAAPSTETKRSRINEKYKVGKIFPLFDNYVAKQNENLFIHHDGNKYRFYDSVEALAGVKNKCISLNPWINGGGDSMYIAARDKIQYDDLKQCLGREEFARKVKLTGDLEEINVIDSYNNREKIKDSLKVKYSLLGQNALRGSKIVICAVPKYVHGYSHNKYMENVETLLSVFKGHEEYEVCLSIHPKNSFEDYKELESKFRCKILEEPLKNIIGIGNMFIVQEKTATVYWAQLLQMPYFEVSEEFSKRQFSKRDFDGLEKMLDEDGVISTKNRVIRKPVEKDFYDMLREILQEKV